MSIQHRPRRHLNPPEDASSIGWNSVKTLKRRNGGQFYRDFNRAFAAWELRRYGYVTPPLTLRFGKGEE